MTDAGRQMPDAGSKEPACERQALPREVGGLNYSEIEQVGTGDDLSLRETRQPLSYRDLRVWQLAREVSVEIHRLTLEKLPRFELHEEGSQIRRASKSVRANIVEGFGRRRYKLEFIKHLTYAEASCDEALDHLDTLFETGSLCDRTAFEKLRPRLMELGKSLNRFIAAVEKEHGTNR